MGELENVAKEVRDFFRHLGAAAGLHPDIAEKVADAIVGPEPKPGEGGTQESE